LADTQTGYPSIDKPWLKYFSNEALQTALPQKTIYEYLYDCCKNRLNRTATNYFGNKGTYSELFHNIDIATHAFRKCGVREGDMVSLCMLNMPETLYVVYALNRIGAICNNIEPRVNAEQIKDRINNVESKILIVVDVFLGKIKEIADKTQLSTIIVVPISRSMPFYIKAAFKISKGHLIPKMPMDKKYVLYDEFIADVVIDNSIDDVEYKKNSPAVIIYTGGTTGVSKGAILSNDSVVAVAASVVYDVPRLYTGDRFLGIMPPFIAYGFVFGMFIPLCAGLEVIQIPNFKPEMLDTLVLKYKPNHIIGVPSFFERLAKSKRMKNKDLSFLLCTITGGDQLLENTEKLINDFFHSHNCKYDILKGYGMTEMGSAVTVTATDECNILGSVGIPSHSAVVKVIDHDTGEELKYNESGEICMRSPGMMLEYLNNPTETDKVMRKHADGHLWIHTGDIGYMNEAGVIFIKGRIKRMIIRPDGHNVWPSKIEEVIMSHPAVSECVCVGTANPNGANGKIPTAYIVVENGIERTDNLLEEIDNFEREKLPERDIAMKLVYIDEIPLTSVGKVDYRALEG